MFFSPGRAPFFMHFFFSPPPLCDPLALSPYVREGFVLFLCFFGARVSPLSRSPLLDSAVTTVSEAIMFSVQVVFARIAPLLLLLFSFSPSYFFVMSHRTKFRSDPPVCSYAPHHILFPRDFPPFRARHYISHEKMAVFLSS